jgi:protein-S-isoprenylcysteine O-methyltransferase Ste14
MLLRDRFIKYGHFLFKYRSYQLLGIILVLFIERKHFYEIADNLYYELFCIAVSVAGLLVRGFTVGFVHDGTSGRNTKSQKAAELNTTGAYSLVRNPLYVGNCLILLGISLLAQNHEVVLLNMVLFALIYVPIISAEESFLAANFGSAYLEYARKTNCFIPRFSAFTKPERNFRLKMVLKREHDTWLTTVVSLVFVEILREYSTSGRMELDAFWLLFAVFTGLLWVTLKWLKKSRRFVVRERHAHD